mgnify:CR=1 FL=1
MSSSVAWRAAGSLSADIVNVLMGVVGFRRSKERVGACVLEDKDP